MANLSVLDSTGATKYLKESGAGTNPDPHIGVHSIDQTTPGTTNGVVVNNAAAGSAVNIQDGGNTITVDGAVTIQEPLSIDDNGASITVDGTVTAAAQPGVDIGDVTINNAGAGSAVNIQDGGNVITVDGAVTAVVSGTVTASAQPGVDIGDVTINNAGAGSAVNIQDGGNTITVDGTVAVTGAYQAIQPVSIDQTTPGTTNGVVINSGTVTTVTTVSAVTAVGTITPGVAATNLGKAEDAQHASGDVGVMAMAVRADTAVALAAHDNDYAPLEVDATGHLHVNGDPIPSVTAAHRTITALDGYYAPLSTHGDWVANPGRKRYARLWTDIVARGCTALADDPILRIRPYLLSGTYVGRGADATLTRPRLYDLSSIKCQKTVNNGVAYTDYSAAVIDNSAATYADLDALDTVGNGDWVVIGGPVPFLGAALDMTANVNTNNAVMTVEYWSSAGGGTWVAVGNLVDGTIAVAGKTLSGDGQISWDLPGATWVTVAINGITAYWVRVSTDAALSAAVEIAEVDLLQPIQACVDVEAAGYGVLAFIAAQEAAVTGTVAYSGTIRVSWW